MKPAHRRHDISDEVWNLLEPHLPGRAGTRGVTAKDNRQFVNAVFGFYGLALLCEIYLLIMVIGKIHIADFAVGEIRECGSIYLKFS